MKLLSITAIVYLVFLVFLVIGLVGGLKMTIPAWVLGVVLGCIVLGPLLGVLASSIQREKDEEV